MTMFATAAMMIASQFTFPSSAMSARASTGYGSTTHIAAEWFKQESKTDILHVPFTGSSAALPALLGGHVDMMFDVVATMWPQ